MFVPCTPVRCVLHDPEGLGATVEWGQSHLVCVPVGMCWVWADTCHSLVVDLQPPEGRLVDMLVGTDTAKVLVEMFFM